MAVKRSGRGMGVALGFGICLGTCVGTWDAWGAASVQPDEAQMKAFQEASRLNDSIKEVFAGGDLRLGYARAIGLVEAFGRANRGSASWDILRQMVASEAANLGMHEMAQQAIGDPGQAPEAPPGLEAVDAVRAIVEASAGRRVVMLNEAHHVGMHREFARRLLRPLREAGFTHLACEAFSNLPDEGFEIDAQTLGYATRQTGYYIADPFFAEMVREAVGLGFRLVPYETLDNSRHWTGTAAQSINRRDASQAAQLAAVLDADPEARVFVYCGYSHLTESQVRVDDEPVRWLGARLRELTGADPLTISQTRYYPRSAAAKDNLGMAGYDSDDAFVLRAEDGLWSANPDQYDIELLHPSTARVGDRPGWMFRAPDRHRVGVDLAGIEPGEGVVLVVTRAGEEQNAIPSDVVALRPGQGRADLTLRAGDYHVWLVRQGQAPELISSPSVPEHAP